MKIKAFFLRSNSLYLVFSIVIKDIIIKAR
nr:MAG TPA: hypothetical protein [Caudoviricetes sp.]